jgi:hypothetical protein
MLVDPTLCRIGDIWSAVMEAHALPRSGVVVEVAPGTLPKIGLALARHEFAGTIHLVDASAVVAAHVAQSYRRLLPAATVCAIETRLASSLDRLPRSCDFLLLNHALDDLILGQALGASEFAEIFDDCSSRPDCVDRVRRCWHRAEAGHELARCVGRTHEEMGDLVAHCRPRFIGIAEYNSWVHDVFGLHTPDRYVRMLVGRLRMSLPRWGYEPSRACDGMLEGEGYDPSRWLLYRLRGVRELRV